MPLATRNLSSGWASPGSFTVFVEWLWVQPGWRPGTYMAPATVDRCLSGARQQL